MGDDEKHFSATLLWLLRGDALQRVIAAWHLGWESAVAASGSNWQVPFLAQTLDDPYAAVRFVAERSLRQYPAYHDIEYDFLGPLQHRSDVRQQVIDQWTVNLELPSAAGTSEVLMTPDRKLEWDAIRRLEQQRDDRPMTIPE